VPGKPLIVSLRRKIKVSAKDPMRCYWACAYYESNYPSPSFCHMVNRKLETSRILGALRDGECVGANVVKIPGR
jgi:hypothetical protein